MKGINIQFNH